MKFSQRDLEGAVVVDIKGKMMGGPEAEPFKEVFKNLVEQGKTDVIMNLRDVSWIASPGIGLMIHGFKTIKEAGGRFVVVRVAERVNQVFNVVRLHDIFQIMETEDDALKYFAEGS